jgi:prepilin-type processing-associated H-X9-DG protein
MDYDSVAALSSAEMNYTGYGMQYHPTWFYDGNVVSNLAIITISVPGKFSKANVWQRKASDRGLVADADLEMIPVPSTFSRVLAQFYPYNSGYIFSVNASRHLKTNTPRSASLDQKGVNLLFCDGHVGQVSIIEAWQSFRNPGEKSLVTP